MSVVEQDERAKDLGGGGGNRVVVRSEVRESGPGDARGKARRGKARHDEKGQGKDQTTRGSREKQRGRCER